MGVLLIAAIIMLSMGAWMPIFGIGTAFILIYYLMIYILIRFAETKLNKIFNYNIYILVSAPLVWIIIDVEGIIDSFFYSALKGFRYEI